VDDRSPVTDHTDAVLAGAREFLELYARETPDAASGTAGSRRRWDAVRAEVEATGTYRHTRAELVFGARVAWRQSVRCVGRIRWSSLIVRDARRVAEPDRVYRQLVRHLRFATHRGRIRSTLTVFAPDDPLGPRVRIWNEQLVRYAGWRAEPDGRSASSRAAGGGPLGDPRQAGFTELALRLGWTPPETRSRWDVLPWVVETRTVPPRVYPLPRRAVLEVPLTHPEYDWVRELDLRWYAVPVIANMRLHIGGVDYSAAPFNGFYLGDEIGSRNLADVDRYDQLPVLGARLGLPVHDERSLWRDRALVELNRAVLHSFDAARVSLADHHSEARHFMRFAAREQEAGRCAYADWSWINSHLAPPLTPTFHRLWTNEEHQPNFHLDPDARRRAAGEVAGPLLVELTGGS
jgi:nitric-oxide synthase, bacterial